VEKAMKHLPKTDSISELAEFWQAHDVTDFEGELEEVTAPVFQKGDQFQVRLSARDVSALKSRARQAQVSESELVSQWVHERLGRA
jgi:predicted DNA binding CopG/RHH family protein